MDSFTQRMLEQAEQRSKALGITSTSKFPLTEFNEDTINTTKKQISPSKSPSSSKKSINLMPSESNSSSFKHTPQRISSADAKENVDVAFEISITTGPNVKVQVEVEEREIDEQGRTLSNVDNALNGRSPMIRDSSRNRLQRLGALYSKPEDLSSPIHRNEARFDDEAQTDETRGKSIKRIGKLAALANQINNWEDESSNSDGKSTIQSILKSPTKMSTKIADISPSKNTSSGTVTKQPPMIQSKATLSQTKNISEVSDKNVEKSPSKQLKWDKNVMAALEQQGFQRRQSKSSKLVYDYKEPKDNDKMKTEANNKVIQTTTETVTKTFVTTANIPKVVDMKARDIGSNKDDPKQGKTLPVVTKGLVSDRAARFEATQDVPKKSQKDPAEMSLKERLALFEKNKGAALIPKAALGISASAKQIMNDGLSPKQKTPEKPKMNTYNKPVFAESIASGSGIRNTVAALMSNATTISESEISNDIRKQREKEMNVLLSRFNRPTSCNESNVNSNYIPQKHVQHMTPPPAPPMPNNLFGSQRHADGNSFIKRKSNEKLHERKDYSFEDDVKRTKINPTKDGRLYPVLSDIESIVTESDRDDCTTATMSEHPNEYRHNQRFEEEDSYMDSAEEDDICNMSLGREIMLAVKKNDSLRPPTLDYDCSANNSNNHDSSTSEYSTNQGDDIDDYINEALDEDDDSFQEHVTPVRKGSICSNSFSYARSASKHVHHQAIDEGDDGNCARQIRFKSPVKSELTVNPSVDKNVVTLTHTVSFYRRQQQSVNTPVRKVTYAETDDDESSQSSSSVTNDDLFDDKMKHLLNEIHKQEQIIKQTSQALNYCAQTFEFSGSTESVESERHLLLATKTRKALLDELTRLKVDRCVRLPGTTQDRGTLTVTDITIPLKDDYIEKLDLDVCNGHHLVCLLTYNEQVLATKTVTTRKGLKAVKFQDEFRLNNVYVDFTLFLEIYGMTAQQEVLPHDIKYHITKKTPKGKKRQPLPSPGGPTAVRTSALTHYGSVTFSIKEVNRNSWSLNQESFVSPLLGKIFMKVHCQLAVSIDYTGFLTMFEDVSGFGAWHRRWCRLNGNILSYWRYPDDEKIKAPMGSIDMKSCTLQKIEPVRRDVCARLHTLLVELKRPCQKDDKNSLVLEKHTNYTLVRHLLSADTKEDRDTWCAYLTKALVSVRSWNSGNKM